MLLIKIILLNHFNITQLVEKRFVLNELNKLKKIFHMHFIGLVMFVPSFVEIKF